MNIHADNDTPAAAQFHQGSDNSTRISYKDVDQSHEQHENTRVGNSVTQPVRQSKRKAATRTSPRATEAPHYTAKQEPPGSSRRLIDAAGDRNTAVSPTTGHPVEDCEYVIDRIVGHGINEDADHPSASVGERTYRVRWFRFNKDEDTFEPIRKLPRNKVINYCRRKRMDIPSEINQAMAG